MAMIGKLYVLKAPGGQLIAETAHKTKTLAWIESIGWMLDAPRAYDWLNPYETLQVQAAAARRRGYRVVKAELVEVK